MKELWTRGYKYRKHPKDVIGRPDIVFKGLKIAIFCDSEFWHGKDWDTAKYRIRSNTSFWHKKIENNMARDAKVNEALQNAGWCVLRFWGEDIIHDLLNCVAKVEQIIKSKKNKI